MSIERSFELQVGDLWDAVLNLSLPAEDQLAILEASGDRQAIDELALALDDCFWVVNEAFSRNQLSRGELDALTRLNAYLNEISEETNAEKWTPEALDEDESWRAVREFATTALADRKSTRLNSSHTDISRMPSSA